MCKSSSSRGKCHLRCRCCASRKEIQLRIPLQHWKCWFTCAFASYLKHGETYHLLVFQDPKNNMWPLVSGDFLFFSTTWTWTTSTSRNNWTAAAGPASAKMATTPLATSVVCKMAAKCSAHWSISTSKTCGGGSTFKQELFGPNHEVDQNGSKWDIFLKKIMLVHQRSSLVFCAPCSPICCGHRHPNPQVAKGSTHWKQITWLGSQLHRVFF